ncbi:cytochrome P450 [Colletotrichum zoysiae]|uniref:Cytochrome P450 n=1 Tax=Colletotrichum zoysiae TaxID=1216348 RepID=A0AAD9H0X7_9PEZI|nr:cytochrome P450 [Colletotrichum zoysiae]
MSLNYSASVSVAVSIVFLYSVVSVIHQYLRLRHIKGPISAGFSTWWLVRTVYSGSSHLEFHKASKKYGHLVRVGPNDIITSDPDLMRHILGVRSNYKRSGWYGAMRLDPGRDNVLSERNNERHAKLRSQMTAGYSGKEVDNLERKVDENVLRFINLIDKLISQDEPFDFGTKVQYFTLDVITDLAFGKPFGYVESDSDVNEYIQTMEQNMPNVVVTAVLPWLLAVLSSSLFRCLLPSDKNAIGLGKTIRIAKEVAKERFGPNRKVKKDMLGSFVAHGLTQEQASSEILMQILAGSDTTATAIRAPFLYIITNPRVTNILRAEIESAKPSRPVITETEARGMPYLQAIIKEGLRIFPPVVGQMSKEVPKGGDTFKGVYFPEGTRIGYNAWGIFRRTDIWGPDAHEFRPERWLEASESKLKLMEGTLELVFSYGTWKCLGRNLAMMELQKVFVELLRRYKFTVVDPTKPWKSLNYGIFLQSQFWIRGERRVMQDETITKKKRK